MLLLLGTSLLMGCDLEWDPPASDVAAEAPASGGDIQLGKMNMGDLALQTKDNDSLSGDFMSRAFSNCT